MKRFLLFISLLLALVLGGIDTRSAPPPPEDPTPFPGKPDLQDILESLQSTLQDEEAVLAYRIYDVSASEILISEDQQWAILTLDLIDRATSRPIPTEPGLALGVRSGGTWEIVLQSNPAWTRILSSVPDDLLSESAKESWLIRYSEQVVAPNTTPYTGYLLPWAGGEEKFLTRSISHGVGGTMHFAFDFAQPGYPSAMFPVRAAKGGIVKYAVWNYPNGYYDGNCNNQNYLVTEHTDTSPTTYTMYLHFAQDTLPAEFRTPGAYVPQGAYIGHADDTGCSSGNHLHIQTHTNPSSYWGSSVDFIFDDVPINDGRPRTPDEATAFPAYGAVGQWLYTSANIVRDDTSLPTGSIQSPAMGAEISGSQVTIQGSAADADSGFKEAQLLAHFNGSWQTIGPLQTNPIFTYSWDFCADQVPDGLVSLALNVSDKENNLATHLGVRHIIKNFSCPESPPSCQPGPNQFALYSKPNYKGDCVLLEAGEVQDVGTLSEFTANYAESIQVGANLLVTQYSETDFQGRAETINSGDRNLSDNLVGANQLSSVKAQTISQAPVPPNPIFPTNGQIFTEDNSLYFYWVDGGGSELYQARVTGSAAFTTSWQVHPSWSLGTLPPGSFTWQVRSQNGAGETVWSSPRSFTIQTAGGTSGSAKSVPYVEDFETADPDWTGTGLWNRISDSGQAHGGTYSWWYTTPGSYSFDTGQANAGYLTSSQVSIPSGGALARFWYRYETEGNGPHWDQRWVQISVDDGAFQNFLQLEMDEPNTWLQSPSLDLSPYANQTVQFRFLFITLDAVGNDFQGWGIDDFTVTTDVEPVCYDSHEPNNKPDTATSLPYGNAKSGDICGPGDLDYFTFIGSEGDRIAIDVTAEEAGSSLDSYLFLFAEDGRSLLASHDDEVLYLRRDSHLGVTLPYDGVYYLLLKDWNHPGAGGPGYTYSLELIEDETNPEISLTAPSSEGYLPSGESQLIATPSDGQSGISHVSFWYHGPEWASGDWVSIGEDWDSSDGWSRTLDVDSQAEGTGMALYAQVYDWAGNTRIAGLWNFGIDRSPPNTSVKPLDPVLTTTAIYLELEATDNVSGLSHLDLQVRGDPPTWQDFQTGIQPSTHGLWFIGMPGGLYDFRSRGTDLAGNVETYPTDPDGLTFVQSCNSPDSYESDNSSDEATAFSVGSPPQTHNLCTLDDQDWLEINAVADEYYEIVTRPTDPTAAIRIQLYASDGITLLAESAAGGFGEWATLGWEALTSGPVFIKLAHINGNVAGDSVTYETWLLEGYRKYMPVVFKKPS